MVQTKNGTAALNLFFLLFCFHVILVAAIATNITTNATTGDRTPTGFSLKLIHRDSSANLTDDERLKRTLEHSRARVQWLKSSLDVTALRPPIYQTSRTFLVLVNMGTGSGQEDYLLELDTGSSLTWTQCVPCRPKFRQEGRLFDPRRSPTYRQVSCDDPLCTPPRFQCVHNVCEYELGYEDGSAVSGLLSRDTFSFRTTEGRGVQPVADLAFGCSHEARMNHVNGKSAGILGMNGRPESFAKQLDGITDGRFSYCLPPGRSEAQIGYLRFGSDIVMRGQVQRTPMVIPSGGGNYYLTLHGVSLGGQRLNLDGSVFARHGDNSGGVIIDSDAFLTSMVAPAFAQAKEALLQHMKTYNFKPAKPKLGTCFPTQRGMETILPSMTFHFEGADLEVSGLEMFYYNNGAGVICWGVEEDDSMSVIGASQQVNKRFTYDLRRGELSFVPEDCAQDAGH